jgi:2-methylisocitrate lyase-like PEP mutase family enzyme
LKTPITSTAAWPTRAPSATCWQQSGPRPPRPACRWWFNARVDVFLQADQGQDASPAVIDAAIWRGRRYLAAGADCVYPIMAAGDEVMGKLADAFGGRVNVLYRPGAPGLGRLAELGVARISLGSGLHAAACSWLSNTLSELAAGQPPY